MHRFFEIFPGALVWITFILIFFFSWKFPSAVAIFFILYALYWLSRVTYLHFHLRFSFMETRKNLDVNWVEKLESVAEKNWKELYHLVLLPMYKEPREIVEETLAAIAASHYPKDKIIIVLGTEKRATPEAQEIAGEMQKKFGNAFFKFLVTTHPDNLPGEIPGKGSNETWAAREAKKKIIDAHGIDYEDVIVSVFDVDTQIPPGYFGRLAYVFLTCDNPQRSSYQPTPLFVNNIYHAPIFSRVMSFFPTFWQMMQQSRVEQLSTYTSQAMPLKALIEVNFWDTHLVSEDSLIFWRFYFHYDGDWRAEPLQYPVSMDATAGSTFLETVVNLYKQQRRWAWGVENIPYMLNGFVKNKKIPLRKKVLWTFIFVEGFYSWATAPFILFILGWLPLVIGGYDFSVTLLSYNLPKVAGIILNFSVLGLIASAVLSIVLLPPKPGWFRKKHYVLYFLQWFLVPLLVIVFSAIPAIESQTRMMLGGKFRLGFWPTPKIRT